MPDTEKEALCVRIDELCAEVERLRLRHKGYVVDLQEALAENAKLRELVRDMWEYIYIGTAQDGQSLHDRTRSLGIEVN